MDKVAVLILTHNEESNIGKCIRSVLPLTRRIFVVDSGSTDRTVEIAQSHGAQVLHRKWTTYAEQLNWALDNIDIGSPWTFRLDADEELTDGLVQALKRFLEAPPENVRGIYVRRRVYFLGRWIRHGGYYPTWLLRVFRTGYGRCEALWMDEHIVVGDGETIRISEDLIDKNNKDLTFWTDKHNKYANREVLDIVDKLAGHDRGGRLKPSLLESQAQSRRWVKDNLYLRMPLFVRPFLYFMYRYFVRLGILDGREGLIFHFLQGFWYRFLVDAKVYEHRKQRVGQ